MNKIHIKTKYDFEKWLSENHWFADGRLQATEPLPSLPGHSVASEATIELAYQIKGNYKANSKAVYRVFKLYLKGIEEYHIPEKESLIPEHCMEGVELIELDDNIGFTLDVPLNFTIVCSEIIVEQLPDLIETVKPWLSEREIFARIIGESMLSPKDWVSLFMKKGHDVVWHIYSGEPKNVNEVPMDNYEGWYLQVKSDLDIKLQGIFFFSCKTEENGFRFQIQNQGASKELWHSAKTIIGKFNNVEVRCGNCEFTGPEWIETLIQQEKAQQINSGDA